MGNYGAQKTLAVRRGSKAKGHSKLPIQLGFEPVKIRQFDYWYLSLLREEKTASCKVN